LGFWEQLYNPDFKHIEFEGLENSRTEQFCNDSKEMVEATNAIGIISKSGRYGGTFAHRDIALEFASWISIEFKLFL
jgi:hypothetical protein